MMNISVSNGANGGGGSSGWRTGHVPDVVLVVHKGPDFFYRELHHGARSLEGSKPRQLLYVNYKPVPPAARKFC